MSQVEFRGAKELRRAIARNPSVVRKEAGIYLKRGTAVILRETKKPAWRVGARGGGTPEDTGNLRQAHRTEVKLSELTGRVYVDRSAARYAIWVHEGTKKMKKRPWLEYARDQKQSDTLQMQDDLLKKIVRDLAK